MEPIYKDLSLFDIVTMYLIVVFRILRKFVVRNELQLNWKTLLIVTKSKTSFEASKIWPGG